jgi:PAS domain S-box-containing protein
VLDIGLPRILSGYGAVVPPETSDRERATAEERLLEREEQYRRIFEATSDGLIVNDLDTGLVVEVNPAFCRMHGYEYDELIGIHPTTFIHPDDHHLFAEYIEAVPAGREFRARAREIHKDGSVFHVEVHATTFLFRGRPHVLGVLRDVSNEVEATRLLERRVAERTHELASLLSLANEAAATHQLAQLVALVLPEVERMLACSWAGIYITEGEELMRVDEEADRSRADAVPLPDSWPALMSGQMAVADASLRALFPEGVSASCSLVVPLATGGETIGILCLARPKGQPFGDEQRALARGVGDQLSVAISNARYFDTTQQAAALEERHRIARDLHDSVSQSLFSLTLHTRTAELALARAGLDAESDLGRPLQQVSELTRGALAEMRALIFELRPGALAEEGLGAALGKHSAAVTAREGLEISVQVPDERLPLAIEQEEHLYRLAQEGLHNTVKHAEASHAWVEIGAGDAEVVLTLRDDGVGFDPAEPHPGHFGLETMRERASRIGAELSLESAPGAGTKVQVRVPVPVSTPPSLT